MSQPSIRTTPASGRLMPAITCSSVVLPQPLSPISTACSPAATWNSLMLRIGSGRAVGLAKRLAEIFELEHGVGGAGRNVVPLAAGEDPGVRPMLYIVKGYRAAARSVSHVQAARTAS